MAASGANVVSIVVQADNATGPGFDAAKASAEGAAGSMDAYAASVDKATAAQAEFDAAQKEQAAAMSQVAELEKGESASADELSAAQDKLAAASLRSADARKTLASAESDVAAQTKIASDEQVASGLKQDESAGLMAGAGEKVKGAFLGIAVGAGFAIDSAMKYDEQSTQLVTGAGELDKNLSLVKQGMLDISTQTATSTSQIQSGMYMIESAGYHGADGLNVLKAAAEGAKVGNADLGTVANAVTTVLTDYKMKSTDAASATSGLVAVVANGKTHMEDLASSLSKVLPTASALKVPFAEVGGAMATMTGEGVSARLAATHLNSTMLSLANPSKVAATAMSTVGLTAQDVANTLTHKGLTAALQEVTEAAGKKFPVGSADYVASVDKMLGGSAGLSVALQVTGGHLSTLKANTDAVASSMKDGAGQVQGWNKVQDDASFKLEKTKQAALNTATAFGEALLPSVTKILGPLSQFLGFIAQSSAASTAFAAIIGGVLSVYLGSKLVNAFSEVKSAGETAFEFIGNIGPTLANMGSQFASAASAVASFVADFASQMASAMAATGAWIAEHAIAAASFIAENIAMAASATAAFIAENLATLGIVAAIAAVVAAVVYLATHWSQVWAAIKSVASDVGSFLSNLFHNTIVQDILAVWSMGLVPLAEHWSTVWAAMKAVVSALAGFFTSTVPGYFRSLYNGAVTYLDDLLNMVKALPGKLLSALGNLGSLLLNAGKALVQGLINGVASMGSALLNAIESLIPGPIKSVVSAALGILSPSKVFHGYGENIVQGLINGVASQTSALKGQMSGVAATVSGTKFGALAGGAGTGASGTLQLELTSSGDQFLIWLRNSIRIKGGNVQQVLGTG